MTADGLSVDIRGVSKTYTTRGGLVEAVRDVSFAIESGELVSLVGPSGCGKSTLLKMAAGLIPFDEGEIDVLGTPAREGRREVGIMLQSPVLLPWRTVRKNVLLPLEIIGRTPGDRKQRVQETLELVGLAGFEDTYPWELSGGMQQRVSLSRLLVFEPDVLLMDEPFAALDEFTRERLILEIAGVHERLHRSVLYVTHNISEAVFLSDRVFVMTARPGIVRGVTPISLPRPRTPEMLYSHELTDLTLEVRKLLSEGHQWAVAEGGT
jgi:NitT/TauT family transport system ATP-binding protein